MFGAARLNTLAKFTAAAAVAGWALSSAAYASKNKSTSAEFTAPTGVSFKTDGTKMYVVQSTIRSYSLSTAWDVSTATYDNVSFTLGATAQDVVWKPDGTIFYICIFGDYPNTIKQYACSTAWDISTASLTTTKGLVLTGGDSPRSMFFRDDGLKMYIGTSDGYLHDCTVGTAWSVSTATVSSNFQVGEAMYGISFKSDGTKLIIVNNDIVKEYTMSSAWTISGLTDTNVTLGLNLDAQDFGYTGLFVKTDGDAFYITNTDSDKVYQFSMSGPRTANILTASGNAQVSTAQGVFGASALFDGTGDWISCPDNSTFELPTTTAWTVEFWIRPIALANRGLIGQQNSGTANGWLVSLLPTGNIAWIDRANSANVYSSTSGGMVINTWYHVAVVRSSSSLQIYIGGTRRYNNTSYTTSSTTSSASLFIGTGQGISSNLWDGGTAAYNGYIDEIRISNTARYANATTITVPSATFGNDPNTVLLIHANGTNASTVFTDDNA